MNSRKATAMRDAIVQLIEAIQTENRQCLICGGHGPLSVLVNGKMINYQGAAKE